MERLLKYLLIIFLYIGCIIFQLLFANNYSIFNCSLNIFIVLILITFLQFGISTGMIFSLFTGIFLDILYITNGFGFYTFSYTTIGFILCIIMFRNVKSNIKTVILFTSIATFCFEILEYGRLLVAYSVDLGLTRLFFGTILTIILNIAPAVIIFFLIEKIKMR